MANLIEDFDFSFSNIFEDSDLDLDLASLNSRPTSNSYLKENVSDDPILTTLSCETNNVLGIVDLPQNLMDPLQTEASPDGGKRKGSPWHESDSGVSDTVSSSGSPEHCFYESQGQTSVYTPVAINAPNFSMRAADELENELAAYLNGNDCEMLSPSTQSNADSEDLSFFTKAFEKDPFINVTSDDEVPPVNNTSSKTIQISADDDMTTVARSRPSEVKILKVVRPSNSSTGVTSEDIAKAMEERSKKNAAQAKLNREKKKAYIQSLEGEVEGLKSSNESLKAENDRMKQEMSDKDEEINYLKSVLANSSALSGLLKNITDVKEVKLSATIMARKRVANGDHSYNLVENAPQKRARLINENLKKAGVCLHVTEGTACLEFCAHCSKLAHKSHAYS